MLTDTKMKINFWKKNICSRLTKLLCPTKLLAYKWIYTYIPNTMLYKSLEWDIDKHFGSFQRQKRKKSEIDNNM